MGLSISCQKVIPPVVLPCMSYAPHAHPGCAFLVRRSARRRATDA